MVLAGAAQDGPWSLTPELVAAQITLTMHVPISTVLDLSREPGSLDGHGPVSAEHVRLVRPRRYRRVLVDGDTGRPLFLDDKPTPAADTADARRAQIQAMLRPEVVVDTDEPQHDPSTRLARLVDLRDVRCCGPGCSSTVTDRDHLQPWPTGPTSARNLGRLSPRCHSAKHHGWTLLRHDTGDITWHSPLHRQYDRPGPWAPPPHTDPWNPPPPTPPAPPHAVDADDLDDPGPLLDRLRPPTTEPPPPPPPSRWPDDPPF